jgi:peptidoglycan/xylan/chitin deacetylase (PgdA/CDA1 family)
MSVRPRAPIFCLHDIVPEERLPDVPVTHRPYALTPHEFRALLMAARPLGRRTIPVSAVPGEPGGGYWVLTFDDGCESDYTEAFPVLVELGLRGTFFVVPSFVGTPGYASWPQLREMVAAGMEIGSHSLTHPFVDRLDAAGIRREFGDSKREIEDRLGCAVLSASLPRGWEPPGFEPIMAELGYAAFCTSRCGWWYPGERALAMPRVAVRRGLEPEEFVAIVDGAPRALWRMQAVEAAKNAAKRCLGNGGWQRLRAPLLALRERV